MSSVVCQEISFLICRQSLFGLDYSKNGFVCKYMEHIGLLGILVNLIIALWVDAVVYQNLKSRPFAFLKPLFHYCLYYSIIQDGEMLDVMAEKYGLSKREKDVLKLIFEGKNNKEIQETLFISYHTVKNHIYNLYRRPGVKNRYELFQKGRSSKEHP